MANANARMPGLREYANALRTLPKSAQREVALHGQEKLMAPLATDIKAAARSRLELAAAKSVRAGRSVHPTINAGGNRSATATATAGEVFFGAEFGAKGVRTSRFVQTSRKGRRYWVERRSTRQFPPFTGRRGNWFYPTVRRQYDKLAQRYLGMVIEAFDKAL